MTRSSLRKRAAVVAACVGATAAVGSAPALAAGSPGANIFGSGSSLQKIAQGIWTNDWSTTPADHQALSNNPTATYTSSSSGHGLAEFGNTTSALDLTQDPTADNGTTNGFGTPVLDAWIGSDDPPTGPVTTPGTNLADASTAATGSSSTQVEEVTVPVTQAPVAIILSLPTGITAGSGTVLRLSNTELQRIYNAGVTATTDYPAKTWGALLERAGWKRVASAPAAQQFTDAGGANGGDQGITLQVRNGGSGTSYVLKGFLNLSGDATYPSSFVVDDETWPVATVDTGNTGGSQLVADTAASPGSVGYANLADAAANVPAFTKTVTTDGNHQILYAMLQNNQGSTPAKYASPAGATAGQANVYTGNRINVNGADPSEVGHWQVPLNGSAVNPTGTWGGTQASDPDVYDHSVLNGVKQAKYPIVAVTYDIGWNHYAAAGSNVVSKYGGTVTQATQAGRSARAYFHYMTATALGQADLANANVYYARLPSSIQQYAVSAAGAVTP